MRLFQRIKSHIHRLMLAKFCISHMPSTNKIVYLTFDDGPDPDITEKVLDILQKYDAYATFFCCGNNANKYPDLMTQILTRGHSIGSHTMSHLKGKETDCGVYVREVNTFLKKYNTKLHRPPFGSLTISQILRLRFKCKLILWNVDSKDWIGSKYKEFDKDLLLTSITPGSIMLFHFTQEHAFRTLMILPVVLEFLAKRGYQFKAL